MKSALPTTAVVIGMLLLVVSLLWGILFPAERGWTEEKAARLAELTTQAHSLMFQVDASKQKPTMHGGKNAAEVESEYRKVKDELESLREEFEGKRDSPKTAASILRWSGIAFVAAGAMILFATRSG